MDKIFRELANWIALTYPGTRPTKLRVQLNDGEWISTPVPCTPDKATATVDVEDDLPFVPNPFQRGVLKVLEGRAMRTDQLGDAVGNRNRLFKPGGLKELRDAGMVNSHPQLGYFRPDAPPPELSPNGHRKRYVYFIQLGGAGGKIKIGVSDDPPKRLAGLKGNFDKPLKLLGVIDGGKGVEKGCHEMFKDDRLHGEWFRASEALLAYIRENVRPW